MSKSSASLKTAIIISRVFDPVWLIPIMLAAAAVWSLYNGLRWRFILILILIDGIIPSIYFAHLLLTKEISDWDTTKRTQRFKLYSFTLIVHAIGIATAWILGKIVLAKILFCFWILALVYTIITLSWKISVHTGVSAAAASFLIILFGRQWVWTFILVALIIWSRVKMRKHTLAQATVGALIAPLLLFLLFSILNINRQDARAPSPASSIEILQ